MQMWFHTTDVLRGVSVKTACRPLRTSTADYDSEIPRQLVYVVLTQFVGTYLNWFAELGSISSLDWLRIAGESSEPTHSFQDETGKFVKRVVKSFELGHSRTTTMESSM